VEHLKARHLSGVPLQGRLLDATAFIILILSIYNFLHNDTQHVSIGAVMLSVASYKCYAEYRGALLALPKTQAWVRF